MWTKHELEDLSETFRDIKLEDIVDEDELAVIKENSTRLRNLKNGLVVPKHDKKVFYTFLHNHDLFLDKDHNAKADRWCNLHGQLAQGYWRMPTMGSNEYLDWVQFSHEKLRRG